MQEFQDGSFKYIKVHIKTTQGVKTFTAQEATKIAGENPDFLLEDLYNAIEEKNYPTWNIYVQVMDPKDAETYKWNIFDMTKVWPHHDYPLRQIGRLTLNRNVSNAQTLSTEETTYRCANQCSLTTISRILSKQLSHRPTWSLDGHRRLIPVRLVASHPSRKIIELSHNANCIKTVLQARMFAYPDAARYRLGTNYQMLPTNKAHVPVYCPFQRDGFMNFTDNYGEDPNYVGSSLKPTHFATSTQNGGPNTQACPVTSTITEHEKWVGEVCTYTSTIQDADFEQPAGLWKVIGREPGHQDRYIDNLSGSVQGVTSKDLRKKVYGMLALFC